MPTVWPDRGIEPLAKLNQWELPVPTTDIVNAQVQTVISVNNYCSKSRGHDSPGGLGPASWPSPRTDQILSQDIHERIGNR